MVCSYCRRKDHTRTTCNVRPPMVCSYCHRKDHIWTSCNVRPLGIYNRRQCTEMDSTTAVRRCAHCVCNVRPLKSDDRRIAGVIDHLATLGSTFACGCCSRTGRVCGSESLGLNLDLTLGGPYHNSQVPLSGKKGVESENEVADAPGGTRLLHPPTPASSFQSTSADNHIEAHPGSSPIYRDGRWSTEEHERFLTGLRAEGKGRWKQISERYVKTRTATQVNSHAQKYFLKHKNHSTQRGGA